MLDYQYRRQDLHFYLDAGPVIVVWTDSSLTRWEDGEALLLRQDTSRLEMELGITSL